jgi:hypothetical protein
MVNGRHYGRSGSQAQLMNILAARRASSGSYRLDGRKWAAERRPVGVVRSRDRLRFSSSTCYRGRGR